MTTIIQKYGFGTPKEGQLAKAEIGVDLTKGYIYSSTDGSDVIELGRGEISWENITGKPPTIDPEGGDYVDLSELEKQVGLNTGQISDLWNALQELEDKIFGENGLESKVNENTANIGLNAEAIGALQDLLNANLTGLVLGGEYDASINQVSKTTGPGEDAGLAAGSPLPTGEGTKGVYVIVTKEGQLSGTGGSPSRSDGDIAHVGDWLVSDGVHGWILFSFGMETVNWGMIGGDIENQEDLKELLELYIKHTDTITCDTYETAR